MDKQEKPIIAVITALANEFAEKELLDGIIAENMKNGYATVVFTIIYNMSLGNNDIITEQNIYDFLNSNDISGIILCNESFVEENVRKKIASVIMKRNIPIVGIGGQIEEFRSLEYTLLNTDDTADIEELTSHLIEEHGFTDIAFLTGIKGSDISEARINGFINAMNKHNIKPDTDKIYYGDFWLNSGRELAEKYVKGKLPYPQAVVCASDMMAYGMLEYFADAHVQIPERISVASYEYSDMRMYYTPHLTAFKRNRTDLGKAAAEHIHYILSDMTPPVFTSPRGRLISGETCPCPYNHNDVAEELKIAVRRKHNNDLSLFSSMEHKLTLCHSMDEYIHVIGEYHWMIKDMRNIYLSLFSNWYDTGATHSNIIQSRSILPWTDSKVFEINRYDLRTYFQKEPDAVVCYLSPFFSGQNYYGYMALMYDHAETYEDVYRNWLKSVSIGLEFLRLKNDIHYLLRCQNISEYRDSMTGLNNLDGMKRAYKSINQTNGKNTYLILLQLNLFPHQLNEAEIEKKTKVYLSMSGILAEFCGSKDYSGRISDDVFACLIQRSNNAERLTDLLCSMLIQDKQYMEYGGMDSFVCIAVSCENRSFDELLSIGEKQLDDAHMYITENRKKEIYNDIIRVRNYLYSFPEETFKNDQENMFTDRTDYFRRQYKKLFGISFHQDCVMARLARAKYYLAVTSLSVTEIAEQCGYLDEKYFQRQFSKATGITPLKYRNTVFE